MKKISILWQIVSVNLLVAIAAIGAVGWYTVHTFKEFHVDQCKKLLERQTSSLLPNITDLTISANKTEKIKTLYIKNSSDETEVSQDFYYIVIRLITGYALIIIPVTIVVLWISNHITKSIKNIQNHTSSLAKGDFEHKLETKYPMPMEIADITNSLNIVAEQLDERLQKLKYQKDCINTVFECMTEPLFIIDFNYKIKRLNRAAIKLFGDSEQRLTGKLIDGIIRNRPLHDMINKTICTNISQHIETEIFIKGKEQYFQITVMPLKKLYGNEGEMVVAMNNITRLKNMESVRRDFVANVSHELKTPVTSIKGYIEILLDGAISDHENAENFLNSVNRQVNRIDAIINNLLMLSKLEENKYNIDMELVKWDVKTLIHTSIQACLIKAEAKNITLETKCNDNIEININPALMEEAIVNLIVNAIEHSKEGEKIIVRAKKENRNGVVIEVEDFGEGIATHHLPRLFERFYRVSKKRTGSNVGTGLGLAIVKHIVEAHSGAVSVKSNIGKGSIFSIWLSIHENHENMIDSAQ